MQTSNHSVRLDWDNFWWSSCIIHEIMGRSWMRKEAWMARLNRGYPDYLTKAESPKWRSLQNWKRRTQIAIFFHSVDPGIYKRGAPFSRAETTFFSSLWSVDQFIRNNVYQMGWNIYIGSRKSDPLNPANNDRKNSRKNWQIRKPFSKTRKA